jgi:hypothetical protein
MDEPEFPAAAPVTPEAAETLAQEPDFGEFVPREPASLHEAGLTDSELGPAINSGRGLFLYGAPGNGKTSIAERITRCFGSRSGSRGRSASTARSSAVRPREPRRGAAGGQRRAARPAQDRPPLGPHPPADDRRRRRADDGRLEVTLNRSTGISEAPLQLKSNCGTLVIDDFGRQRMSTDELLNRWIVPLEKRYDFLNLPNGKKIQVPFDQLIIFSTNLEPRDLVDDAFLRRIPYKIEVVDPTEEEFRELFKIMCPKLGFEYDEAAVDYLIETHYKP